MKETGYMLNILLAALWGAVLAGFLVCRTLFPAVILPGFDIPLLLGVSLAALLAEHYLHLRAKRPWAGLTALAAATFGLLPLCAGAAAAPEAVKLALSGGTTVLLATALFDSVIERLSSASAAKAAPAAAGFVLFLAGQCFTNILF